MVQTYEGALTETDSILQRMKTLADQSANGTYQDDVDRDAIQLEFDQLNDELNQIADTDFNGVVVLNGGQMADGTIALGGKFNYGDPNSKAPKELTGSDVTIGDKSYAGTNDETVTFTATRAANGNITWKASAGALGTVASQSEGGFTYDGATFGFDTDGIYTGDSITVKFTKNTAAVAGAAPAAVDYSNDNAKTKTSIGAITAKAGATPASESARDDINALNGVEISYTTDADGKITSASMVVDGVKYDTTNNAAATASKKYGISVTGGKVEIHRWDADAATAADAVVAEIAAGTAITKTDAANQNGKLTLVLTDAKFSNAIAGDIEVQAISVSNANAYEQASAPLTYTDHIILQSGARTKDAVDFTFKYKCGGMGDLKANMNCSAREDGLGTANLSLKTAKDANYAIDRIDNAINKVSMVRATFGAVQNRLEHKIDNMNVTKENMTSAESRIRDTNMADEMTNFTKNQILSQASQAMLAQANQLPQGVLQLLG